jgi:aryl-alcohol dehydrogenase-like predicted oxidoreductase
MQTVRLGRTSADVSVAGLGCGGRSRLGMSRGSDAHQAATALRQAPHFVTFVHTARVYDAEETVGEGIAGRRDEDASGCSRGREQRGRRIWP